MGVPALFRWLSKKYPHIVTSVKEDLPTKAQPGASRLDPVTGQPLPGSEDDPDGGGEDVEIPVDMSLPNPNGEEFDCLYLDMNGIVHPCTHPEGKPPPETEADMMVEIFAYTERVVNMIRPRKLLLIAIDGVAPRAKMNQQRSRRFRASQEAKTKAEEKEAAIREWEAMGKEVSDEYKDKKAWDQNAITPGTPFMDLLAASLRYWVASKLNSDPGWSKLQVVISDASVPGEGEHKIMDYIRRQRSHAGYDPNTRHVIYGLDADLIMLSLATHEPYFKVLREDVFAQDRKPRGCHRCGQPGHHSSNCTGAPKEKQGEFDEKNKITERKPFIFLDVSVLREYLEIELNVPGVPFPFDLERAIDDWVFLIFFVGNDFLPHLPSLEIREGAIDTLLAIWRTSLPQMGDYLTSHGKVNMKSAQFILDGLARREDEIFQRRRDAEERQDRNEKRRRLGNGASDDSPSRKPLPGSMQMPNGTEYVEVQSLPSSGRSTPSMVGHKNGPLPPFLPARPTTIVPAVSQAQLMASSIAESSRAANQSAAKSLKAQLGVTAAANSANLSAAERLKAELKARKTTATQSSEAAPVSDDDEQLYGIASSSGDGVPPSSTDAQETVSESADSSQELYNAARGVKRKASEEAEADRSSGPAPVSDEPTPETHAIAAAVSDTVAAGLQAGQDESEVAEDAAIVLDDDEEGPADTSVLSGPVAPAPLRITGNVAEQDDTVKLWEPGYKERYYQQKFGVPLEDKAFRDQIVKNYMEGLSWVLAYYYQGCPSWQWFYPWHFAPFASDFTDLEKLDIQFELGAPFRPFEQLMGVFPAASRKHIPAPFHDLMTSEDSPIIDFYPEEFMIDMNGKKMLWQGVALLPFIDSSRLLAALDLHYHELSEDEERRNGLGSDVVFVNDNHGLYEALTNLYGKKPSTIPVAFDSKSSDGLAGLAAPDPDCVPGTTFFSPFDDSFGLPHINNDRSVSAVYHFPPQLKPHRSMLLPGVQIAKRVLTARDKDSVRRGTNGQQQSQGSYGEGFHSQRRDMNYGVPRYDYANNASTNQQQYQQQQNYQQPYQQQNNFGAYQQPTHLQQPSYGQQPAYGQQAFYGQRPAYGQQPGYGQQQQAYAQQQSAYGQNFAQSSFAPSGAAGGSSLQAIIAKAASASAYHPQNASQRANLQAYNAPQQPQYGAPFVPLNGALQTPSYGAPASSYSPLPSSANGQSFANGHKPTPPAADRLPSYGAAPGFGAASAYRPVQGQQQAAVVQNSHIFNNSRALNRQLPAHLQPQAKR
ncbi:hypothetical protein E5Q_04931 [Mixia osmundae IAM 14324]|uniref:5'-3' exoribonuclease 2 n=1 Tax=Mixia osmundae (strain CBS 9802 / IAM 14324 / JCM 22182 / KY 12970) TaxID=764103 RepID=G7E5Y8_MIXOS|nr:hypothetical protein E5Q_04931 [Mixia osmundae IAM 14324]